MKLYLPSLTNVVALCLSLVILSACTMSQAPIGNPEQPYPPEHPPAVDEIYHLPTGTLVTLEQMLVNVTDSRVVFVGETHDNPAAHRLELQVLQAMAERYPEHVSLGLEMFHTGQQDVLDKWVAGELDEKTFLKESQWYDNWKMDFDYYRDILVYAQEHKVPVIGLNAPEELVKAVGKQSLEELDEEWQSQLPEMDLDEPYQRALAESVFAGHSQGNNMIDGFHRIQTLWDETMAANVVEELRRKGPEQRMVVMAGGNHVRFGFGIPRRVYRRLPVSYSLIGVHEVVVPKKKKTQLMDIEMPNFPMVPYDYQVNVAYESLPQKRVKLGVRFKEDQGRILVESVVPGSSADQAGVIEGDIITALGGVPINDSFDLIYEVNQHQLGDATALEIERENESVKLEIVFKELPEENHHQ